MEEEKIFISMSDDQQYNGCGMHVWKDNEMTKVIIVVF
jgi:hypothetical protein